MNDRQQQVVLKAWDTYQSLIRGLGENCWKIRSVFYTASFALIAIAYSSDQSILYLLNVVLALLFFFLEAGYRRLQSQYIRKTLAIERTLNDILAGEAEPYLPDDGISTGLETPSLWSLREHLSAKRYLFWMSYAVMAILSLALFTSGLTKADFPAM